MGKLVELAILATFDIAVAGCQSWAKCWGPKTGGGLPRGSEHVADEDVAPRGQSAAPIATSSPNGSHDRLQIRITRYAALPAIRLRVVTTLRPTDYSLLERIESADQSGNQHNCAGRASKGGGP